MQEEVKDLIYRLLENVGYWDGYPRITIYNDEVIETGLVDEYLYEILKALSEYVEEA